MKPIKIYLASGVLILSLLAFAALAYIFFNSNFNVSSKRPHQSTASSTSNINRPPIEEFQIAYNSNSFEYANRVADYELFKNPTDVSALLMKAHILAQEASLQFKEKELGDQAMNYVIQAIALDPDSAEGYLLEGYIHEIQQNYPAAYRSYDKAIALDPFFAEAYAQKGHAEQLEGKDTLAGADYAFALKNDPNNILALFGTAKLKAQSGDVAEAKALFLRLAGQTPNARQKAESYHSAAALTELENPTAFAEIDALLQKAIAADSSLAQSYVLLGRIQFEQALTGNAAERGQLAAASLGSLSKAIALNKNLSSAHLQLAEQLVATGRTADARLVLKSLPKIIVGDISLTVNEKRRLRNSAEGMLKKLN